MRLSTRSTRSGVSHTEALLTRPSLTCAASGQNLTPRVDGVYSSPAHSIASCRAMDGTRSIAVRTSSV